MKKIITSKKAIVALLVTLTVVAISAVGAYAYWSKGGQGTGSATVGAQANIVINQTPLAAGALYPGGAPVALSGSFTSTNPGPTVVGPISATITSVTHNPTYFPAQQSPNPCTAADFVITGTAPGPFTAPGGSTGGSWSGLSIQMIDSNTNQNGSRAPP